MKTTHHLVLSEEYIAEAQRSSIAQHKTLKFMYQMRWVQWLARAVMIGFIIFSLLNHMYSVAAMFVAFLASFWGEWFGRRNLAKARRNVRAKGSTSVVSMNEQGVDIEGTLGNSHLKWPCDVATGDLSARCIHKIFSTLGSMASRPSAN